MKTCITYCIFKDQEPRNYRNNRLFLFPLTTDMFPGLQIRLKCSTRNNSFCSSFYMKFLTFGAQSLLPASGEVCVCIAPIHRGNCNNLLVMQNLQAWQRWRHREEKSCSTLVGVEQQPQRNNYCAIEKKPNHGEGGGWKLIGSKGYIGCPLM